MEYNGIFETENIEIREFNKEEFFKKLIPVLQNILNTKFGIGHPKTKITVNRKTINFGCPICGDGRKGNNRRGNIHMNNFAYKCYNDHAEEDGPTFKSLGNFLRRFHVDDKFLVGEIYYIDEMFKKSLEQYESFGSNNIIQKNNTFSHVTREVLSNPLYVEADEYAFPREEIFKSRRLCEIRYDNDAIAYLKKRKIIKDDYSNVSDLQEFAWNNYYGDLYIFNLASNKKDIIGIQIRHLSPDSKRRFTSMSYGDIWEKIFKKDIGVELKNKFNKLSLTYNILNVDFSRRFYILEGSIDAYFVPNSLACWGLSNFIYNKSAYYITDNTLVDNAGKQTAVNLLKENYNTFLWGKFCNDHCKFTHCKDINDMIKLDSSFDITLLNGYFSNDDLDIIWL